MSLKVWLPLDGDLRNLGTSDIEVTNNGATVDNAGKIGKCYSFDGLNDYITITYSNFPAILAKNFSITFWVYSDDDGTRSVYFGNYGLSGSGNWFNLEKHTANEIRFWWNNGNPDKRFNNTKILSSDGWTHFTLTKNEGIVKTYLNGQLIETYINEGLSSAIPSTATIFRIGGDYRTSGDLMFKGKMNDFRIYDHCLSAAEVHEIAQGLVLHYKLDGPMGGANDNYIVNSNAFNGTTNWGNWGTATNRSIETINNKKWFHFIATAGSSAYGGFYQDQNTNPNQISIKPNTNYTISALMFASDITQMRFWFHMRSTEGGANISQPNKIFSITTTPTVYTFTFNSGSSNDYTINRFNLMIGAAYENSTDHEVYFTDVKFEEGAKATHWVLNSAELGIDTTIIEDSSGYNHHAFSNGSVSLSYNSDTPRYALSTQFASGARIMSPITASAFLPTDAMTVNLWFKSITPANRFISCTEVGGWNFESTGGKIRFSVYVKGKGYELCASNTTWASLGDNNWHMLTGVYDRTYSKIYIDGELDTTFTLANPGLDIGYNTGPVPFCLGAEAQTIANPIAGTYVGNLSDIRIYCTPLLDRDIKLLYNMGMKVDNLYNAHVFEYSESDNIKLLKSGQLQMKNYIEQNYLFNDNDGWSYNPDGNNNSTITDNIVIDVSQFYKCDVPVQFAIEYDLSWTNLIPNNNGVFSAYTQGNNYNVANQAYKWEGGNYFAAVAYGGVDITSTATNNSTGTIHVSKTVTVPATWFNTYSKAHFGFRTNYATGTITLSNLKVTLIADKFKINSHYATGNNFIEI